MASARLAACLLAAFCAVLLFVGMDAELFRNEGLRARQADEMLAGGSWVVPTLHGEPHLTKPPGMSILIGLCSLPVGRVTPVTARLPSVLAAAMAIGLVGWTFSRAYGLREGLLAAAILPCSPLWLDRVPSAEIDLVQLAWVTASLLGLFHAAEAERPAARWGWWLFSLAAATGGLFTKWTAPAFFYLTAVPWLWWRGRLRLLLGAPHLVGFGLAAALFAGWVLAVVSVAGWPALSQTAAREALLRLSPGHHPRPYPWDELVTFPLGFLAGCLPWSLALIPAFSRRLREHLDGRQLALWQLCQVWLWTSLVFWTVVPGHRPRHLLPAQPAAAMLAALVWVAWSRGHLRSPLSFARPTPLLVGVLGVWLAAKLVFVGVAVSRREAGRGAEEGGKDLARLVSPARQLHVFRLRDEGLLFYYGGKVRRLHDPSDLSPAGELCLLSEEELRGWPRTVPIEVCARLPGGRGIPAVLARRR